MRFQIPDVAEKLGQQIVEFVQRLRAKDLFKRPGIAETTDWAKCLLAPDTIELSPSVIADTLGALLKYQDDIQSLQDGKMNQILDRLKAEAGA